MNGFKFTILVPVVVLGTDCTGSWKSNYHTIMAMTTPKNLKNANLKIDNKRSINETITNITT